MKIALPLSGGLDSFIALKLALSQGHEVTAYYVDMGQPYAPQEAHALDILQRAGEIPEGCVHWMKLPWLLDMLGVEVDGADIWIPGRNLLLATLGSMFRPDEVWLGACKGEMHTAATDKNQEFMDRLSNVTGYVFGHPKHGGSEVKVTTPFSALSKLQVVAMARDDLGISEEALLSTWSCLGPKALDSRYCPPCGNCMVCVRRMGIFTQLGFKGMDRFIQHPYTSKNGAAYVAKLKASALALLGRPLTDKGAGYAPCRIEEVFPHWREGNYRPVGAP